MRIPVILEEYAGLPREAEPVTGGIPLARGAVQSVDALRLVDEQGELLEAQLTPQLRWSDGSLQWIRLDGLFDVPSHGHRELWLTDEHDEERPAKSKLITTTSPSSLTVDTGMFRATYPRRGPLLASLRSADGQPIIHEEKGLQLILADDHRKLSELEQVNVDLSLTGPTATVVTIRGRLGPTLLLTLRATHWAGRGLIRLDVTLRNPRAAQHEGGTWDLGDPGSLLFHDISLRAKVPNPDGEAEVAWTADTKSELSGTSAGLVEVYQDSSGGENWQSTNHVNRNQRVPLSFKGYRVRGPEPELRGDRASPTLWVKTSATQLGATVREFWQCFPKALVARNAELSVHLWPGQFGDLHELQGGEQKTHTVWLSAEELTNLGWTQSPLILRSTPEHYASSGVFPQLIEWRRDENVAMLELTGEAIDDEFGLMARRETIDEYGWRNFGDVWADHENVGNESATPRISHYNNQYDGIYGALAQFLRTGEPRWFWLADEMARHVADIDIYHTELDRSAFSGGMFWHTDHYTDAATSTHRCYTRRCPQAESGPYGGGPAAEHDYSSGLRMHALMTGWAPSREGVLTLANWVINMDAAENTLAGRLLPGPAGLATRTDDHSYHGPGRGAGNSIETLLDAFLLTKDERYLDKAEALIRRVVHPDDDRELFQLLTAPETRWSYIVLLLSLIHYLEIKVELGELDERYAYAQASLVAYGRWMLEREDLSSTKKDLLEIWTESWPAQDLRKGLILLHVSRHLDDERERASFIERGRELLRAAEQELLDWETKTLTRPLILVMRYAYMGSALSQQIEELEPMPRVTAHDLGQPSGFVPWKGKPKAVIRRFKLGIARLEQRGWPAPLFASMLGRLGRR